MEEDGLYRSRERGRVKFYSLNKAHPLFKELKTIVFKTEGVQGSLRGIVSAAKGVSRAFIYGSYAKDKENASSDIDLVVTGDFDRDGFTGAVRKLEHNLGRQVNFNAYTDSEFEREKKKRGGFLNLVLKDKIIALKGKA